MSIKLTNHALILVLTAGATAQVAAIQPKAVKISEGITLTPTLDAGLRYDDNIYEAGVDNSSSWVANISPNFLLESVQGKGQYQLGYSFNSDIYDHSEQDSDTDHHLKALAEIGLNRSNRLSFYGNYDRVENVSDTTIVGENDKFETSKISAVYGLGMPARTLSLDLGVNHEWYRTFNSGSLNLDREYDKPGLNATGYYRLGPKTRALLEYRHDEYDYILSSSILDSDKDTVLVGITWSATRQTTGTIKFGQEKRDFDDSSKKDQDGSTWEADLTWQPGPRSSVSLSTMKGTEEGSLTEDFIDTTKTRLGLLHQFSPRVTLDTFYGYSDEEYQDLLGREDEVNEAGVTLRYNANQRMSVGVGYSYKDRSSNLDIREYDRNIYMLNVNLSL